MIGEISLSELFDRYLEDDLNILDKQEFELRLAEDPQFAQKFKLHKEVDRAIMESDIMDFRNKLKIIEAENQHILEEAPMEIASFPESEIEKAILEQDIIALRNQLNRIHSSIIDEVDAAEIPGYSAIEEAIINQDAAELNNGLKTFNQERRNKPSVEELDTIRLNKDIDKAIMQADVMELRNKLEAVGQEVTGLKVVSNTRSTFLRTVTRAAAVLVFLVAGGFALNQLARGSGESSMNAMFDQYTSTGFTRGTVKGEEKAIQTAIQLYNDGDYEKAEAMIDYILNSGAKDLEVLNIYGGHSAMEINNIDKAIQYLSAVSQDGLVYINAQWYLSGCYIRLKKYDQALAILENLKTFDDIKNYDFPIDRLLKDLKKKIK